MLKRRKNILFIAQSRYLGGAEILLSRIIHKLNRRLFNPAVLLREEGTVADYFRSKRIRVETLSGERWPESKDNVINYFKRKRIDLAHTMTPRVFDGALAAKLLGIPHIWHIYTRLDMVFPSQSQAERRKITGLIYSLSDKIIVCSEYVKKELVSLGVGKNITVLNNGIDLKEFNKISGRKKKKARSAIGIKQGDFLVILACRLSPEKRVEDFIKSAAYVIKRGAGAKFVVIGEDNKSSYAVRLKKLNKKLEDPVIFAGFRPNASGLIASADLLVSTSIGDALSLAILEAMASSVPVIVTRSGGSPEIVTDKVTGLLVPPKNHRVLADRIIELMRVPQKREDMARLARKRAVKLFDIKKMVRGLERIYGGL